LDLLGQYVLFSGGVEIWAPSILDIETNYFSTKRFNVSMATFCIDPLGVSPNMSFSGQGTIPTQLTNKAFSCARAFKHIVTPTHPLPSCQ
jgi:hypothetical protein